jgi:hypothetical protein
MAFSWFRSGSFLPVNDIAVDLGTANTLVYVKGEGIVLNEPSVVAMEKATNKIKGIGLEAKRMLGRTPEGITAVRPLKDGVIADVDVTEIMLRYFLETVTSKRFLKLKPTVVVGVPSGITELERRAVRSERARGRGQGGVHGGRADGGGHRRGSPGGDADREHGDRHRGRDHGDRGDRAVGDRLRHLHPRGRRRDRRWRSSPSCGRTTT